MQLKKLIFFIILTFTLLTAFSYIASPRITFYSFSLSMPEEVVANPGDTITVNGSILVTGMYWLHMFDLTVDGLPYEYELTPSYSEHVRILREWNPEQGVYRIPEKFYLTIKLPEDAAGVYLVNVTGQEHHSWRQVSNSTYFILRVLGVAKLSISDIVVPETVTETEPFNISFTVKNEGTINTTSIISIDIPEDWTAEEKSKSIAVPAEGSTDVAFTITPTASSGNISLFMVYPFKETIINVTKIGPYLTPATTTTTLPPTTTTLPTGFAALVEYVEPYITPLTIGIAVVLLIIVIWLIWSIVKYYTSRRKPERMKRQSDTDWLIL